MKYFRKQLGIIVATLAILFAVLVPSYTFAAANVIDQGCAANPKSVICQQTTNAKGKTSTFIQNLISTLLFVLGIIAVIMIVISGIRYATAGGDSNKITGAKNTILYAVIGLVVALLAYSIVNFIVAKFK